MADRLFNWLKGLPFLGKIGVFFAAWLIPSIALLLIFGSDGQERGVQAPERVQARRLDPDPHRAHQPLDQQGGPLPVPGERADDLGDGLHRPAHAAEAEPRPDRGRGRLRPDQEQHHRRRTSRSYATRPSGSPSSRPSSSSSVLEHDRLPAAADEHAETSRHLRPGAPDLRALRRDGEHLVRRSRSPSSSGSATTSRASGRRASSAT